MVQWFIEVDLFIEVKKQISKVEGHDLGKESMRCVGLSTEKQIKQARNAGSLDRGNIKIIKQIIQEILPKYRGAIRETNMFLPEIDFVLYLWKKGIFL